MALLPPRTALGIGFILPTVDEVGDSQWTVAEFMDRTIDGVWELNYPTSPLLNVQNPFNWASLRLVPSHPVPCEEGKALNDKLQEWNNIDTPQTSLDDGNDDCIFHPDDEIILDPKESIETPIQRVIPSCPLSNFRQVSGAVHLDKSGLVPIQRRRTYPLSTRGPAKYNHGPRNPNRTDNPSEYQRATQLTKIPFPLVYHLTLSAQIHLTNTRLSIHPFSQK